MKAPAFSTVPILLLLVLGLVVQPTSVQPAWAGPEQQAAAAGDTLRTPDGQVVPTMGTMRDSRWGPIPDRTPASTGLFGNRPRPGWEKVAMVPYHLVSIPFDLLGTLGHESLKAADNLGWFDLPPAEHFGLELPGKIYAVPVLDWSESEGLAYGLDLSRYDLPTRDSALRLELANSTKRAMNLALGTYFPLAHGRTLQLGCGYTDHPMTKYFGVGPDSRREDLSYYNRESWWLGLEGDQELGGGFDLEVRIFHSRVRTSSSRYNVHQQLERIHAGNLPLGFGRDSHGMTYRLGLRHDTTVENARPQTGGFRKISIARFLADDGSDLEYTVYRADLQHFLPLWHTRRTLAVRAFFNHIDNKGDVDVPLMRLMTFAKPDQLRGFTDQRWLGKGTLGFSAEYRWPIWAVTDRGASGLDAYLFSDVGQVFLQTEEIAWEELQVCGGFGLRLLGAAGGFVGRMEVGLSREETVFTLKFSQTFQFDKRGLLGGKDPTRRR